MSESCHEVIVPQNTLSDCPPLSQKHKKLHPTIIQLDTPRLQVISTSREKLYIKNTKSSFLTKFVRTLEL